MASLLLVTLDAQLSDAVDKIAQTSEQRFRSVASAASAREWLAMQHFDVVVVDSRSVEENDAVDLLLLGFKHNPVLVGAILGPDTIVRYDFQVQLIGGHVFDGKDALDKLAHCLTTLPARFTLGQKSYYGILVVEDLDAPRDIICAYVESLGYPTVRGVRTADEALRLLEQNPYEYFCVITDLRMPQVDGIELIRRIRNNALLAPLPVIALTSSPSAENLSGCLSAGATGFLAKPPKKAVLRRELEKAKRILLTGQSPRLWKGDDARQLETLLRRHGLEF
ncbi:MAG: response regulator [Bdellovibrionales bacterium]|nr:response regulator [Bdellovibrionales bacterium]